MKMFILVYREFMLQEVHDMLHEIGVKAYSEIPKVLGLGELGRVDDSRHGPGHNNCIFAAVPDEEADFVVRKFREYNEKNKREYGRPAAFRAFLIPCEQVI